MDSTLSICEKIYFPATIGGGADIAGYFFPAATDAPKGVIQICHGMAEYIFRYDEMIKYFNDAGWHVCGMDMLGHGNTFFKNEAHGYPKGWFGPGKDAMKNTIKDEMTMHKKAKERFGTNLPYILCGHSMGSMVSRSIYCLPEFSSEFKGFVFASTVGPNPAAGAGLFLCNLISFFGGAKKPGKFVNAVCFGSYNKRVKNPISDVDWVTSDKEELQKYIDDPMCGFLFTNQGFASMLRMVKFIQSDKAYADASTSPCLLTYGSEDPVGSYGTGVEAVAEKFRNGTRKVTVKNYGPYRHEIQREEVRGEYFADLVKFFEDVTN